MVESPFGFVVDSVSVAEAVRVRRQQQRISGICIFSIRDLFFHRVGSLLTILEREVKNSQRLSIFFGANLVCRENFMFAVALKKD